MCRSTSGRAWRLRARGLPGKPRGFSTAKGCSDRKKRHPQKGLASMRKIGSLGLTIGASIVAVSAVSLIFLAFAADRSGQVGEQVAGDGQPPIPDPPDWNWDVRPILSQTCS